jgi:hypothetical protein
VLSYLPANPMLVSLIALAAVIVAAYLFTAGYGPKTGRGFAALAMSAIALLALYQGTTLAFREAGRVRHGRLAPGVVTRMQEPVRRGRMFRTRWRRWASTRVGGVSPFSEGLARAIAYGSVRTLDVEYRYPCRDGRTDCSGRDLVRPELWSRLAVGMPVGVRQGPNETATERLDENPQLPVALVEIGLAAAYFAGAAWLSGCFSRKYQEYVPVAGMVTAVEEVQYRGAKRWKVRFAYLDRDGNEQTSAAEVAQPGWRTGDACAAVYPAGRPDLATLTGARL